MKSFVLSVFSIFVLSVCAQDSNAQGMAVNSTGAAANASAVLDASSTTQGVLVPRMTSTERTAIVSPATGLLVYQTNGTSGFYYYNGTAWATLADGASGAAGGDLTGTYPNPTVTTGAITGAKIATNTITTVNLPAGATASTFLRGDNTWATPSSGGGSTYSSITAPATLANTTAKYIVTSAGNITLPTSPTAGVEISVIGMAYNIKIVTNKDIVDPSGWTGGGFFSVLAAGTWNLTDTAVSAGNSKFAWIGRFVFDGTRWIYLPS